MPIQRSLAPASAGHATRSSPSREPVPSGPPVRPPADPPGARADARPLGRLRHCPATDSLANRLCRPADCRHCRRARPPASPTDRHSRAARCRPRRADAGRCNRGHRGAEVAEVAEPVPLMLRLRSSHPPCCRALRCRSPVASPRRSNEPRCFPAPGRRRRPSRSGRRRWCRCRRSRERVVPIQRVSAEPPTVESAHHRPPAAPSRRLSTSAGSAMPAAVQRSLASVDTCRSRRLRRTSRVRDASRTQARPIRRRSGVRRPVPGRSARHRDGSARAARPRTPAGGRPSGRTSAARGRPGRVAADSSPSQRPRADGTVAGSPSGRADGVGHRADGSRRRSAATGAGRARTGSPPARAELARIRSRSPCRPRPPLPQQRARRRAGRARPVTSMPSPRSCSRRCCGG